MSRTPVSPRRASGFTLIELMIVVAIIGILAALMAGAIGYVQNMARRNECLNNLRQWGGAMSLYLDEHRSRIFPTFEASVKSGTAWFNVLPPYLEGGSNTEPYANRERIPRPGDGSKSPFLCPSDDTEFSEGDDTSYYSSYTMNLHSDGVRDSTLKSPATFVVMTETCNGRAGGAAPGEGGNLVAADGSSAFRHNKSINLLFADGHAANYHREVVLDETRHDIQWENEAE